MSTYDDTALLEHLERVYDQEKFVISDSREVAKYARRHDWVVMKELYNTAVTLVKPSTKGKVVGIEEGIQVEFEGDFEKSNDTDQYSIQNERTVSPLELKIYQKKTGRFSSTKYEEPLGADVCPPGKGDKVIYVGQPINNNQITVPDGTEGIIGDIKVKNGEKQLKIVWKDGPGLYEASAPLYWNFKCQEVELVIVNRINFKQLYEQSRSGTVEKK